jgi:isoleucyl-tRNA synthetase
MAAFDADGKLAIELNGENVDITPDMVEVRIDAKEGFAVAMENNVFTILDTTITPELEAEGLARELISKVQQMRKQNDYEMMDNIKIYLDADEDVAAAVDTFKDYIMKETLAVEICGADEAGAELNKVNLNGHKSGLALERI